MSTKFYIKDENGKYLSTDGQIKYTLLEGKELYAFLKSEAGRCRKFHVEPDESGNKIGIEIEPKMTTRSAEQHERDRYRNKVKAELNITIVSANTVISIPGEEDIELIQTIPDDDADVEESALHNIDLETLRGALKSLSTEEYKIIFSLYLAKFPLSERQLAAKMGIAQMTLNYRKQVALRKLKKFF